MELIDLGCPLLQSATTVINTRVIATIRRRARQEYAGSQYLSRPSFRDRKYGQRQLQFESDCSRVSRATRKLSVVRWVSTINACVGAIVSARDGRRSECKPLKFWLHNSCTIAPEQWLFDQQ